jgi:hypothetical protein
MAGMTPGHRARLALLAVALVLLGGCGGSGDDASTTATGERPASAAGGPELGPAFGPMTSLPGALKRPPPWPANNDGSTLQRRLRAIGLEPLSQEGQALHIHQHLDLYVDGERVTVPAQIGIDAGGAFISDLHTHETDGIMHVESPKPQSFTLGQFFAVWGLPLGSSCIGGLCEEDGRRLRVWVDGREVTADPTRIVLAEHQEIAIAYGTRAQMPDPVPRSFDFEAVGL